MKSKFIIACAGSGKTTTIINETLETSDKILVTTFTDENCDEIKRKYYQKIGFIPINVVILPWFTFELRHLINPFRLSFIDNDIKGINLVQSMSAPRTNQNSKNHYIDENDKIYSDKIALLSFKTLKEKGDRIFSRLRRLFKKIYIDEFQDFAGYDLEIVKELMENGFPVTLVGDPRQRTFSTHFSKKNKQYNEDKETYIRNQCSSLCDIDTTSLNYSYRCPEQIITYASLIFPNLPISHSNVPKNDNDGIYIVLKHDTINFIQQEQGTVQLRLDSKTKTNNNYFTMTFGKSKGTTHENVLIYPTQKMKKAILLNDFNYIDSNIIKCKFYVALTRAKHKVGIVMEDKDLKKLNNPFVKLWK